MSPPSDHFNEKWQLSGSSILTPKRETNVGALELPDARLFTLLRRLLQAITIEKSGQPRLASPPHRAGWGTVGRMYWTKRRVLLFRYRERQPSREG